MAGMEAEIFFQRRERFGGPAVVNQRDAQAEHALRARGVGVAGAPEGRGSVAPPLEIAVANAQVETRRAMLPVDVRECRVSLRGGFVIARLILDVAERGIETRVCFAVFDRLGEKPPGAFRLALQMQGNRLGERLAGAFLVLDVGDGRYAGRLLSKAIEDGETDPGLY